MTAVRKVCHITMDTAIEPKLNVHRKDGSIMRFTGYSLSLYYYNASNPIKNIDAGTSDKGTPYYVVNTVDDNKQLFTRREIKPTNQARELYAKFSRPSQAQFESILSSNLFRNYPVMVDGAKHATYTYGLDVYTLKEEMTHHSGSHMPKFVPASLPNYVLEQYHHITLAIGHYYLQGLS